MKRARTAVLAVLLGCALSASSRAYVWPVWDILGLPAHYQNLINNYVTLAKQIYAVEQRAQQIYQYYQEMDAHYRELKNWRENGVWHTVGLLYGDIQGVMDRPDTIGYESHRLLELIAETYPEQAGRTADFLAGYHQRMSRTLTTTTGVMDVLQSVGALNHDTQLRLREAQARVQDSDGKQQALQASSMVLSLGAEEAGRAVQAVLARANANAVRDLSDLQDELEDSQRTEALLAQPPLPTNVPGFSAVPASWPWQ